MKKIGFIGIGLMGFPMAKNLLKSGYNLKAYNRSQDKADRLKEFGAEISTSIKDVVTNSDVVITMLTEQSACQPTCCRLSEITLAHILISAWTSLASFTPSGPRASTHELQWRTGGRHGHVCFCDLGHAGS